MGINVASSFTRNAAVPLDDLTVVADLTARDAIASGVRYQGMVVFVVSEGANFQLIGGTSNSNWEDFGSSGGGGGTALVLAPTDAAPGANLKYRGPLPYYEFSVSEDLIISGQLTVPASYKPGNNIVLENGKCFSNLGDITKTLQWDLNIYLFKDGDTLDIGSESAQQTETTATIALLASANKSLAIPTIDVAPSGAINSVDVDPGDLIYFELLPNRVAGTNSSEPACYVNGTLTPNFNG